jgi:hypothetical protein
VGEKRFRGPVDGLANFARVVSMQTGDFGGLYNFDDMGSWPQRDRCIEKRLQSRGIVNH